jgi:putative hydrolase of the HAD superfamily
MKQNNLITTLFLDIGGVLLDNGWDHLSRRRAAKHFKLNWIEMEQRHIQNASLLEEDRITLDDYVGWLVFYEKRPFSRADFRRFMFAQSKPCPDMIGMIRHLKGKYGLKIIVLSNESRELNAHRIHMFRLDEFVDAFVSSCFVHLRKPDPAIFRMALDISQTAPGQILYIENTPMFVHIAEDMGIRCVLHANYKTSCAKLASLGLIIDGGVSHAIK